MIIQWVKRMKICMALNCFWALLCFCFWCQWSCFNFFICLVSWCSLSCCEFCSRTIKIFWHLARRIQQNRFMFVSNCAICGKKKSKFIKYQETTEAASRRCSVKKVFLEFSQNSTENTCARVSLLIKLHARGQQLY